MTAKTQLAEIVGAGFAGLAAAVALLQRGWTVRVHERTPLLRAEGFGIALHDNGLRVLAALGVRDRVLEHGLRITRLVSLDSAGRVVADRPVPGSSYRLSRHAIVAALAARVVELGGCIDAGDAITIVEPDGTWASAVGAAGRADLIVVADGIQSALATRLGLVRRRRILGDGAMRFVTARLAEEIPAGADDASVVVEQWSGSRRLIYSPCARQEAYVALSCHAADAFGQAIPLHADSWRDAFPTQAGLIAQLARADSGNVFWQRFQRVELHRWSRGRIVVLGDAAHAMPPNLGQGAGCALMNALSLAVGLEGIVDLERELPIRLVQWEARERPLTEHVQRWSTLYGRTSAWPERARSAFFALGARSRWVRAQLERCQRHVPTGTSAS